MSTQKKIVFASAVTLLLLALFASFVWPTPYRTWTGSNGVHYRISRFTHKVEYEIGGGWYDVDVDPSVRPIRK